MAHLRYLADTSVVSRLHQLPVLDRLEDLLVFRQVAVTPLTALEAGFSARSGAEYDDLSANMRDFEFVEIEHADFQNARFVQRALAATGHRGRAVPDLIIAAVADRLGLTVVHYDRDFELIAAVTGQPHEWIVTPGSID